MNLAKSIVFYENEIYRILNKTDFLLFLDKEKIQEGIKLGSGGFGKIVVGNFKSLKFAIKKLKEYNPKELFREITILKKYSHPSIARFYGIVRYLNSPQKSFTTLIKSDQKMQEIQDHILGKDNVFKDAHYPKFRSSTNLSNQNIEIGEEIVEGYTLLEIMKKFNYTTLQKLTILRNLAQTLEYLHDNGVIHRDLKPENIMLHKDFGLKLIDFGISKIAGKKGDTKTRKIGTLSYMAPENFQNNEDDDDDSVCLVSVSEKVDVWAFGCIVQELMTGVKPWSNKVKSDMKIMALLFKKIDFEITKLISRDSKLYNLIEKCTLINIDQRIKIKEAKSMLENMICEELILGLKEKKGEPLSERLIYVYKQCEQLPVNQKFQFFNQIKEILIRKLKTIQPKYGLTKNSISAKKSIRNSNYIQKLKMKSSLNFLGMKILQNFQKMPHLEDSLDKEIRIFLDKTKEINDAGESLKNKEKNVVDQNYIKKLENGEVKFTKGVSCIKKSSRFDDNPESKKNEKKVEFSLINYELIIENRDSNLKISRENDICISPKIKSTDFSFSNFNIKIESHTNKSNYEICKIEDFKIPRKKLKKILIKKENFLRSKSNSKNGENQVKVFKNLYSSFPISFNIIQRNKKKDVRILEKPVSKHVFHRRVLSQKYYEESNSVILKSEGTEKKGFIYLNFPSLPKLINNKDSRYLRLNSDFSDCNLDKANQKNKGVLRGLLLKNEMNDETLSIRNQQRSAKINHLKNSFIYK